MADFKEALQKARNMIHNDAKRDTKIIKERVADRNNPKYFADQPYDSFSSMSSLNSNLSNSADYDSDRLDEAFANMTSQIGSQTSAQPVMTQNSMSSDNFKKSKMPKAILESLANDYIDQNKLSESYASGLDDIVIPSTTAPITERVEPVQVQSVPQVSGIDYSLIKTIVEECIRKYAGSITKKILSEQKSQSNEDALRAIKIGENFTFITSNGDLYEAELKFKKNINKNTKKGN